MVYRLYNIFPEPTHPNVGIVIMAPRPAADFAVLAVDAVPDLSFYSYTAQFFSRWKYTPLSDKSAQSMLALDEPEGVVVDGYRRIDNITDHALADYRQAYGTQVGKDDIFHYVYGLLHSLDYRHQFAADLKKMLPRIPLTDSRETFEAFVRAGLDLMDLHLGYERVEPWPDLVITGDDPQGDPYDWYRVRKMAYGKRRADGQSATDQTTIVYNPRITVSGIPPQAQAYKLGSRSALDWIIERHQIKTDKASGIVNDPNDWSREHHRPRHILDLLTRIVTVSLRTVEIVESLPRLDFTPNGAKTKE
jgi:predicted helicase